MVLGMTDSDPAGAASHVGQPHDGLFKAILGKPEHAASQLRSVLPHRLTARLDLDHLEKLDGNFVDQALHQKHTDLLFRTRLDDREALLYFLVEHQASPDHWMAFRIGHYLMRIWDRHLAEHPKTKRLPPIIPIVVYQGRRPWTPPLNLTELIDTDPDTKPYAPTFTYLLDELSRLDVDQLRARPLTYAVRLTFYLMRAAPGNPHLTHDLTALLPELAGLLDNHQIAELNALWAYAYRVSDTPAEQLIDYLARFGPDAQEVAMSTADVLRAEGRAEAQADTLLDLLSFKFADVPSAIEATVRHASTDQLTTWSRRVLTATTIDEVFA